MPKYDEKFKRAIVQKYLSGDLGYIALSAKFGIKHTAVLFNLRGGPAASWSRPNFTYS
jgi:transposase-like protein